MQIRELSIPDAYEVTPRTHADDRGLFFEFYRFDSLKEYIGHTPKFLQGNTSVSRRGSIRGIHFADIPPSQAKYVSVQRGSIIDFVIDVRLGSPTFGAWDSVLLDDHNRKSLYIAQGLGHCFIALEDHTTVSYLVTDVYRPKHEHGINPLDETIGLEFPMEKTDYLLSEKDLQAPGLDEAKHMGLLSSWEQARAFYASLDDLNIQKAETI